MGSFLSKFKDIQLKSHKISYRMGKALYKTFHGFTRESKKVLEDVLAELESIEKDLQNTTEDLLRLIKEQGESDEAKTLVSILTQLEMIKNSIFRIVLRLKDKLEEDIIFSDRAVNDLNHLFSDAVSILEKTSDAVLTLDKSLAKSIKRKAEGLIKSAHSYAASHEERLVRGICLPKAGPIYLDIIDSLESTANHCIEISKKV